MADDNDSSSFRLDLDVADFVKKAGEAKESIDGIGESEGISQLVAGLAEAGVVLGGFGLALYAIKEVIDVVFDAEKIKQTQVTFDALSTSAGVYSKTLIDGLKEASGGLVDETALMSAANQAMVKMQVGVAQLPQLMDLARNATKVMGGDVIDNFNKITQAVASGNAKQLKRIGITIDQTKAYRDYATVHGGVADALSLAGKQQAVLNAALDYGEKKLASQGESVKVSINLWQQVKVTLTEIGEVITLAFEKIAGPTVAKFFGGLKLYADQAKTYLVDKFGQGAEQASAHADLIHQKMLAAAGDLYDTQKKFEKVVAAGAGPGSINQWNQLITAKQNGLKLIQAEYSKTQGVIDKQAQDEIAQQKKIADAHKPASGFDPVKQKEQEIKAAKELNSIESALEKDELKTMTTVAQAEEHYNAQKAQQQKVIIDQMKAIDTQVKSGALTRGQAAQQEALLEKRLTIAKEKDEVALEKLREQAMAQYVAHSKNAGEGVSRAFEQSSEKSKHALTDWGAFGDATVNDFSKNAVSGIQAWASGSKSATDAMESMFAGMVGQMASQYGQMMLLASIFPPDPVGIAAGTALIALGGALGAVGSSSSSSSAASAPAAGSAATPAAPAAASAGSPSAAATSATPAKSVTLVVQGHMFMNDQTQRWLVDQVRAAADATDFKVQSVGGGL